MIPPLRPVLLRAGLWLAALLALALVFASYLRPELVVDLGNRFWSCF
jgi:hypothetical protein